jgi:hypothetical protein
VNRSINELIKRSKQVAGSDFNTQSGISQAARSLITELIVGKIIDLEVIALRA